MFMLMIVSCSDSDRRCQDIREIDWSCLMHTPVEGAPSVRDALVFKQRPPAPFGPTTPPVPRRSNCVLSRRLAEPTGTRPTRCEDQKLVSRGVLKHGTPHAANTAVFLTAVLPIRPGPYPGTVGSRSIGLWLGDIKRLCKYNLRGGSRLSS